MTSFKFPPPPPPPPKATASQDETPAYASNQRGSHYNSRGDRGGRGRDGGGRGRGNNFRGNSRGGHGHNDGRSNENTYPGGHVRGGYQPSGRGGSQQNGSFQGNFQQQQQQSPPQPSPPKNVSAGTYVNPLFANQMTWGAPAQPQINPMAFAQAMAFMTTQTGMQSMTAFANHMAHGGSPTQYQQSPQQSPQPQPSLQQHTGKRKRDSNHGWSNRPGNQPKPAQNAHQPKQKPQKAKVAPPPAVPSFGFALPVAHKPQPAPNPKFNHKKNQNKHKVHLGLAPRDEQGFESSSDEDIDEEAAFAADFKGSVFEYEGLTISLQTPAEVSAWRKERRKQYPTTKRVEEKVRETVAKRAGELEFLRMIKGKKTSAKPVNSVGHMSTDEERKRTKEKHQTELEELRKRLQESAQARKATSSEPEKIETSNPGPNPPTINLGVDYDSDTSSEEDNNSDLEESSVVSSSEESSDSDSEFDDSDSTPEEQSSKVAVPSIDDAPPPPPARAEKPQKKDNSIICEHWKRYGRCKYGDRCRRVHPPKEENRVGLYDKLVEQEKKESDRLALQAIKYLGSHGFLG
ncbi:hypothetical protein K469DRAFT_738191 [Zopfia rhizophila CBS 207.26]|uniref:C3H1-type domain-containing protein n=1 Tax=Zopfia rhizophila CBS 207.26 TaxID=1314779 RepID=A0A6A6E820_9PEZI|nr:hypothetical protein K469DRAFT_738191 [Zopfia rhizophila CBS 207.26]